MERRYFTKKGGIYIRKIKKGRQLWIKQEKDGQITPLIAAVHISRKKLKELVREYPSSLLDKTYCFDVDVEREFFEDVKREKFTGSIKKQPTVIFFLVKRQADRYGIGCSSIVKKIQELD